MGKLRQRSIIICGFPGVGKSSAAMRSRDIFDLESSVYHYDFGKCEDGMPKVREHWEIGYVDEIEKISSEPDKIVLVSTHEAVTRELNRRGLQFIVVIPSRECKDEYLKRYIRRVSSYNLIYTVWNQWEEWLDELEASAHPVVHLEPGEYLTDILPVWK